MLHKVKDNSNLATFTFLPPEGNENSPCYLYHEDSKEEVMVDSILSYAETLAALKTFQATCKKRLAEILGSLKCSFTSRDYPGKKYEDLFINFINGDIVDESHQVFSKVEDKWFKFSQDFKDRFTRLVSDKFKEQPIDAHLGISWPLSIREDEYNQLYSAKEGYYVADTIFLDNIKLFDIMKICEGKIFLFHVKAGIGQNTRVACSQIRDTAMCVTASIDAGSDECYLARYFDAVVKSDEKIEGKIFGKIRKGEFLNLFKKNKIVFVYAFREDNVTFKNSKTEATESKPAEKELKDYKDLPEAFSRSHLAMLDLICTDQFLIVWV